VLFLVGEGRCRAAYPSIRTECRLTCRVPTRLIRAPLRRPNRCRSARLVLAGKTTWHTKWVQDVSDPRGIRPDSPRKRESGLHLDQDLSGQDGGQPGEHVRKFRHGRFELFADAKAFVGSVLAVSRWNRSSHRTGRSSRAQAAQLPATLRRAMPWASWPSMAFRRCNASSAHSNATRRTLRVESVGQGPPPRRKIRFSPGRVRRRSASARRLHHVGGSSTGYP
jgi:hypothetical protein